MPDQGRSALTRLALVTFMFFVLVGTASPAVAKSTARGIHLAVAPAKPWRGDVLQVRFRLPRHAPARTSYWVQVDTEGNGSCASRVRVPVPEGYAPGDRVTVPIDPAKPNADQIAFDGWCDGRAAISLVRVDGKTGLARWAGIRGLRIAKLPTTDLFGTKIRMEVLDGSSLLVQANGRPDRTIPVSGSISGFIPGRYLPGKNFMANLSRSDLRLALIPTDAVCSTGTLRTALPLTQSAGRNVATFAASGAVSAPIAFAVDPLVLSGCAAPEKGSTELQLSGVLGPAQLGDVALTGTAKYVTIADGVVATVTANLRFKVVVGIL